MSTPVAIAGTVAVCLAWAVFPALWITLNDWLKLRLARRMGVPVDRDDLWWRAIVSSSWPTLAVMWLRLRRR